MEKKYVFVIPEMSSQTFFMVKKNFLITLKNKYQSLQENNSRADVNFICTIVKHNSQILSQKFICIFLKIDVAWMKKVEQASEEHILHHKW